MPFTLFNIYEKIPSVYGAYSVCILSVQLSLSCVVDVDQGSLIIQYRKARKMNVKNIAFHVYTTYVRNDSNIPKIPPSYCQIG